MTILSDAVKGPFLTLMTEGINGWYMASCPEFGVSVRGINEEEVKKDLYDMIKMNASIHIKNHREGKKVPIDLFEYSVKVVKCRDVTTLFRHPPTK